MRAGSLVAFAQALLLAGAVSAVAQQRPPRPPPTPPPAPPPSAPLPPGPAALSVPDPLAGFRPGPRDLYRSPDGSDRYQQLSRHPAQLPSGGYPGGYPPGPFYPGYGYGYGYGAYYPGYYDPGYYSPYDMSLAETSQRYRQRMVERGGLVLQTIPDMAQVYVDGYYVGLAEEFGLRGRVMDVEAGTHRIELRAPGYETLAFSVVVAANDTVRYRGDMQPLSTKPSVIAVVAAQSQPAAPRSFYVIPNCYAGDKPPSGTLPKGCDVKKLQTRK